MAGRGRASEAPRRVAMVVRESSIVSNNVTTRGLELPERLSRSTWDGLMVRREQVEGLGRRYIGVHSAWVGQGGRRGYLPREMTVSR